MFRRLIVVAPLILGVAACNAEPDRPGLLRTAGWHVVDDRGWAVGSDVSFSADSMMMGALTVELEQDTEVISEGSVDTGWYGAEGVSGVVAAEGEFDLVVTNQFGIEQERRTLAGSEISDFRLGVLLDDCPEYPDLVLNGEPTLLEGSTVNIAPAPVDADGNQLLGYVDYSISNTITEDVWGDEWEDFEGGAWQSSYLTVAQPGDITFTIDGVDHVFGVDTVSSDDVVELEIAAIPEKHGIHNESLLCALGKTADGRIVHGINADWSGQGVRQTIHAENSATVEACFDGKCATWNGVE